MSLTADRASKLTVDLSDPLVKELWVIEKRIAGSAGFNSRELIHVVPIPLNSDQVSYDRFVKEIVVQLKASGFAVAGAKVPTSRAVYVALFISWH